MKDLKKTYKTDFIEVTDKIKYFELINFVSDNLINTLDYDVLVYLMIEVKRIIMSFMLAKSFLKRAKSNLNFSYSYVYSVWD